mgnify:CR=1 FL=1
MRINKEFEKNISYMKTLKSLIPFFIIAVVIIWIIYFVYSPRDFNFKSNISAIIFFVFIILLMIFTGWVWYKIDIWTMNKNIQIMEKMHKDIKEGRKPSKLRVIFSIIFLILVFPVMGSLFLYLGIYNSKYKLTLFGAGLWACVLYAIFVGVKNHYSK